MKISPRRRVTTLVASTAVATLVLSGVGSSAAQASPKPHHTKAARVAKPGGTITMAEQPGAAPNYIFPLTPSTNFATSNLSFFQTLMYRPLYWFGVGQKPEINYTLSVGKKPVYSNNDKTVTISLNNYKWSDGEQVSAQDVIFWMNLVKANKAKWAAYVPGAFPDNIVSYKALGPTTVQFQLNQSYNPTWFTYNELSQITPLPLAWDKTSMQAPSPSASTPVSSLPDQTTAGAVAVYNFLNTQAGILSTYATSPIWSIVDGPYRLQSFTTQGKAVFIPNKSYTGPVKSKIAKFIELPFTSESTEFNVLRAGKTINYGYIPYTDLAQKGFVASQGYKMDPWTTFGFNYFVENFNNPVDGAIFKQLYFRQAFQRLVDQQAWIKHFAQGLAVPTYGPVPIAPKNNFASAYEKKNPYPYSVSLAAKILKQHGWAIKAGGASFCAKPGSGANECGTGITKGEKINIALQYVSGVTLVEQEMQALKSAASNIGINVQLSKASFNQVISNAAPCSSGSSTCTWQMENWGAGWVYAPDYLPTGGEIYSSTAGSNFGSYNSAEANALINATHTSPNTIKALTNYENYITKQLPVVFTPNAYFQLSEVSSNVRGITGNQNPYANLTPEYWSVK